jgi:hypothetical protein
MGWFAKNVTVQRMEIAMPTTLTKTSLEQIFIQVDADPLAGRGHLTKREILIDRILAHVRACVVEAPPARVRPILDTEPEQAAPDVAPAA